MQWWWTPSTTHAGICLAAAAGKAIFCEKPLALTLAECEQVGAAVRAAGVPFPLGFMRRFDPGYAAAHQAIAQGAIGEVVAYTGISRDLGVPPREYVAQSGGIREGRQPQVGAWDGRQALAIALAAGRSQQLGQPVPVT